MFFMRRMSPTRDLSTDTDTVEGAYNCHCSELTSTVCHSGDSTTGRIAISFQTEPF